MKARSRPFICINCLKESMSKSPNQKYCSLTCKKEYKEKLKRKDLRNEKSI